MGYKAKSVMIKLLSEAGSGYFYMTRKNPKNIPHKLQLMKLDPLVGRHVLFTETKFKRR